MDKKELIEKVFNWSHELDIVDKDGNKIETVYQRLVGDADLNKSRMMALRYSKDLRALLRDETTDEYQVYIDVMKEMEDEELVSIILFNELLEIRKRIDPKLYFPEPEEPEDDASNEKMEDLQAEYDSWEERRNAELDKLLKLEIEKRTAEIRTYSRDDLLKKAITSKIEMVCETEIRNKFSEACAYLGTYTDKNFKNRLFTDFDEFLNSQEAFKSQLIKGYNELEMSSVSLKESRRVVSSAPSSIQPLS